MDCPYRGNGEDVGGMLNMNLQLENEFCGRGLLLYFVYSNPNSSPKKKTKPQPLSLGCNFALNATSYLRMIRFLMSIENIYG